MKKKILVIGGTRFFGKLLVQRLLDDGHHVTIATRGLTSDTFGDHVQRIKVDRRDLVAMQSAFRHIDGYDIVYDQMCYTPLDAAISADVFAQRTSRYVMSSTIEVYQHLQGHKAQAYEEGDIDLHAEAVNLDQRWHEPAFAEMHYGLGKRQAEAYFYQDGRLPVTTVRIAHVLAGADDFTGRLAAYVELARNAIPLRHSLNPGKSSFIDAHGIANFLYWAGERDFLGPINAAHDGALNAIDIHCAVCRHMQCEANTVLASGSDALSPFDFRGQHIMNTARAKALGYRFTDTADWLDGIVAQHANAALQRTSNI